ncbi:low temperature requirement protein A [Thermoactinospora rubra]|uniref:low temperature requirement protein A n=1 Tax=Thermoactinospora rubra TaxID=1088767 RepID=UPI000A10BD1D|nr:low temperature requirement protein A [Thermoactinospora rubra]
MTAEILRSRSGLGGRVAPIELFFDLVYVFAVTQLSHLLLDHLSPAGVAQTALLMLAVWWAWMYTTWTTNYLSPEHPALRLTLAGVMLAGLVMAAALPSAFDGGALLFAGAYVAIQLGRTIVVTLLARGEAVQLVFARVLVWMVVSAVPWIAGAFVEGAARGVLWTLAVLIEYTAPWHGYLTPRLGRSATSDWTIDGGHMAERCQLFVIIALGESVLVTGATLQEHHFGAGAMAAFVVAFLGSVALWWVYFDRTAEAAAQAIAASDDPGRLGRSAYTFIHLPMVAGIIVAAVGDELVIAHPGAYGDRWWTAVMVCGGPALFLAGHALFKRAVFGYVPINRVLAVAVLVALIPLAKAVPPLALAAAAMLVVWAVAIWDAVLVRRGSRNPELAP